MLELHHVSINVTDVERSLDFYRDTLGLGVLPRPDFPFAGAWLETGDGRQVHLIAAAVPDDVGQHVAFRVDDIDDAVGQLRAVGLEVPEPQPITGTSIRQTFIHDPDGNRIELTHVG